MLTVHHLGRSQSERIVWLCEELGLPYELRRYDRRADNRMAPPDYQALHPMGTAPVLTDGDLVLGESGAICDYLIQTRGAGRLAVAPGAPGFADYLYWYHFANGTLQPLVLRLWMIERADASGESALLRSTQARFAHVLGLLERRLGEAPFLAGADLTAADIMTVFTLTTMRRFKPFDLSAYPSVLAYLQRIGARPAYRRAMEKADPGSAPVLGALPV